MATKRAAGPKKAAGTRTKRAAAPKKTAAGTRTKRAAAPKKTAAGTKTKRAAAPKKTAARKPGPAKAKTAGKGAASGSDKYTDPALRERIKKEVMAGSEGGRAGQWSARKAQLVAARYKKAGGGYKGEGRDEKQESLRNWGKEKWRTEDGEPAARGKETARYLPDEAWRKMSPAQKKATDAKKRGASRKGKQFVANTAAAKAARARAAKVRGHAHA